MADFVFNVAKGAVAEKVRDNPAKLGVLLLKTAEADSSMKHRDTVADLLAGSTEADFTNYSRKTGLTGTVTVDDVNDRTDVSLPNQTWIAAGGATNNTLVKAVIFYEESASDSGRIPLVALDFVGTTDGTNLSIDFDAAGFYRAA